MTNFTHLHLHTDYSMLDGLGKTAPYVSRAKQLGMSALSMTDHGNVSGSWEFYKECRKQEIEPILGVEFYFVPDAEAAKDEKDPERFHVVMLARNFNGFRAICDLNTAAHSRFYYKPLLDRGMVEGLSDSDRRNIICLSGCAASIISKLALEHGVTAASDEVAWWAGQFPKNFYIELQHHNTAFDRKLNRRLLSLSARFGLEWVITNDPHYVMSDEEACHDALLAIQTGADIDSPERFRFDGSGYHLRSRREMARAFRSYGDEVWLPGARNTGRIARRCRTVIPAWDAKSWHIPAFPDVPDGLTANKVLRRLVMAGLRERGLLDDERYVERVRTELAAIRKVGIADFLLITWDMLRFCRENNIRYGPGRGSVCGCLVAYLIGIHKRDSIRRNLRFERFLNPERPKMPDIDTDIEPSRRPEVVNYLSEKYGAENTARVAAFQTMKLKSAFQTLGKAHGITPADRNKYTKLLGDSWGHDDPDEEAGDEDVSILPPELRDTYPDLAWQMEQIVGTKRAVSRHASGVVIYSPDDPIKDIQPQQWLPSSKTFASQFDLHTIEGMGCLKQDLLGLRTLATIGECVRLVKGRHGIDIEPDDWSPDEEPNDRRVYKMLADGRTAGVFQLEGGTMFRGIQEVACNCFEDIVSTTSLYRAGPMIAGAPSRFLRNRRSGEIRVIHPSIEPVLADSWGEMIYQEQMMDLAVLAGFDMGLVADLLAAVRFKDPELMEPLHQKFVAGFQENQGADVDEAEGVWRMIEAQASYLFNRSHADAYSFITYQTARLKFLYPLEFLTALLRTVDGKDKKRREKRMSYLSEAVQRGIRILPPHINDSMEKATCGEDEDGPWIRFGFFDCSGIGEVASRHIVKVRTEEPAGGFLAAADASAAIGKRAYDVLAAAGALEDIGGPRLRLSRLPAIVFWRFTDPMTEFRSKYESRVRFPKTDNGRVNLVGEIIRHESRKTRKDARKFVVWTIQWAPGTTFTITIWEDANELWDIATGSIVRVTGRYQKEWNNVGVGDPEQVRVLRRNRA